MGPHMSNEYVKIKKIKILTTLGISEEAWEGILTPFLDL